MDHEERFSRIDRQFEFLAGNHGQLWADLQELQQISRRHSEQLVQVGDFILRLGRVVEEQGRQLERRIENERTGIWLSQDHTQFPQPGAGLVASNRIRTALAPVIGKAATTTLEVGVFMRRDLRQLLR